MNALIHSFDRIEPPPRPGRLTHLFQAWRRFADALRESRDRRATAHLSEWNDHMLRDVGLTRDEARIIDAKTIDERPLSDGRWVVDQWRLTER